MADGSTDPAPSLASGPDHLDADPAERMRRRAAQIRLTGKEVDEEELLQMIIKRDHDDQARTIAPLCKAEDAIVIDTSVLSIDEVVAKMLAGIGTTQQ